MNSKKLAVRILLCLLAIVSMFTVVGCKEPKPIEETYVYANQLKSVRYYFEQGYPDNWIVNQGTDGNYIKKIEQYADGSKNNFIADCGLVAQISPNSNTDKVKYSVYALKYHFMRGSLQEYILGLVGKNPEYNFPLNDLFLEDPENKQRDAFVWTTEVEDTPESISATTVFYNKIQFQKASYNFTVDGVDWKGMMLVANAKEGFYVITLETAADVWDANYAEMEKMLSDFRLLGWESKE